MPEVFRLSMGAAYKKNLPPGATPRGFGTHDRLGWLQWDSSATREKEYCAR